MLVNIKPWLDLKKKMGRERGGGVKGSRRRERGGSR